MLDEAVSLWEIPIAREIYMIAGWHQWADAGTISSGLPLYLIEQLEATKIGEIDPRGFYLFQLPGAHHFLRPEIKLEEGHRKSLTVRTNEFYYVGDEDKGLVIFIGHEPHLDAERYSHALLSAAQELGVKRIAAVGGVYGAMPFDKDRMVSCVYSLQEMKEELEEYAVRFSDYEGGTTIGTYLADGAEKSGIELVAFFAFVPAYDFSSLSRSEHGLRIETDYKAWYDILRRLNHMFGLGLNLSDLIQQSQQLVETIEEEIAALEEQIQRNLRGYLDELTEDYTEQSFTPLGDIWAEGLEDIFGDTT